MERECRKCMRPETDLVHSPHRDMNCALSHQFWSVKFDPKFDK